MLTEFTFSNRHSGRFAISWQPFTHAVACCATRGCRLGALTGLSFG
jgi:hypothetical protein